MDVKSRNGCHSVLADPNGGPDSYRGGLLRSDQANILVLAPPCVISSGHRLGTLLLAPMVSLIFPFPRPVP